MNPLSAGITRRTALLATAGALPAATAFAQTINFPIKAVRLITPFPVGSGPEGVARLVADKLSRAWGQPVTVENKPGGNGFIAIDAFKRGATDGYDLIQLDNVHLTAYPHMFKKLPYAANKDFELVAPLFKTYFFITTAANSKYRNVADLIADAKAKPGGLSYGSWSVGNPAHLGSALFETVTGTNMQHVVYKETTQLYTGVANGELSFAFGTSATAGPLYRAGKLKFLAIAAPRRLEAYKDVPTVAEAGGPANFEVSGWTAIAVPRGLPPAVVDKIRRDVVKAVSEPDVREKFASFGYEPFLAAPPEFAQHVSAESARLAGVIKAVGAHLD
ncbi:MAG: tripartite tricarboxylate transporter substrate binding protein [Burkholderiales bacterium]|nr:tripartite tricarboxylate transporter substrate binding protein [Burkholderiales bacterium]